MSFVSLWFRCSVETVKKLRENVSSDQLRAYLTYLSLKKLSDSLLISSLLSETTVEKQFAHFCPLLL